MKKSVGRPVEVVIQPTGTDTMYNTRGVSVSWKGISSNARFFRKGKTIKESLKLYRKAKLEGTF